jgi:hypothetical protein
MLEKLKFWKKKVVEPVTQAITQPEVKENLFICHHCGNRFEVTSKMQFPVSVPMIQCDRYVQGIGVQCPKCLKNCIYG